MRSPRNRYKFFKSSERDKFYPYEEEQSLVPKKFTGRDSSKFNRLFDKRSSEGSN